MTIRSPIVTLFLAVAMAAATGASAQEVHASHAGYVYPAGGRQGTTVLATVGGHFPDGVDGVIASGSGIQARVLEQRQLVNASDAAPSLSGLVTLEMSIDREAEPGRRWLRLMTPTGLTNALVFEIGQLPEFDEPDDNADSELVVRLPATVNGRIFSPSMPADVDRYRFAARKGQCLVVVVSARHLQPYLADAAPGWFQATVALLDARGHELSFADGYRHHPDPVLHHDVTADGEYVLEIRDALYRGRQDFVYRIAIGELPFVTGIFPLGGRRGARTRAALTGWNLPADTVTMGPDRDAPAIDALAVSTGELVSNPAPFAVDELPEAIEHEPNDLPGDAQQIEVPAIVNGRIDHPGDWDAFTFAGQAGDRIVADVYARRLGSPLDSVLELIEPGGRWLAFNDDYEDKRAGWLTHHADSLLTMTLPADGAYFLRIGDVQHKGGAEYAYRLRVRQARPDFDLLIAPSSPNVAADGTIAVTVYALRMDGFSGDIELRLRDAPEGFLLGGAVVPSGQDQVQVMLIAKPANARCATGSGPARAPSDPVVTLHVEGRATIDGRTLVHEAMPVDDVMQAFTSHRLVPTDALRVRLSGGAGGQTAPDR